MLVASTHPFRARPPSPSPLANPPRPRASPRATSAPLLETPVTRARRASRHRRRKCPTALAPTRPLALGRRPTSALACRAASRFRRRRKRSVLRHGVCTYESACCRFRGRNKAYFWRRPRRIAGTAVISRFMHPAEETTARAALGLRNAEMANKVSCRLLQ